MSSVASMADRIGALVQPLKRLLAGTGPARTPPPLPLSAVPGDHLVELDRILIFMAHPEGSREQIRLMTRQMSLRSVVFTTRGDLAVGQDVQVQVLLEPGFALEVQACVAEVCRGEGGENRGRLSLFCGPFERGALASYLDKRNVRKF